MRALITGGAGYIGSHAAVELLSRGCDVSIIDNFANSSPEAIARIEAISGQKLHLYDSDLCDERAVEKAFSAGKYDIVLHFAGYKSVNESVVTPLVYYENNLNGTLKLCQAMIATGTQNLIFSSTAALYDASYPPPFTENSPIAPANPYGKTKWFIEQILEDLYVQESQLRIACLRYFNPIGAHQSGNIGESAPEIPSNILPYLTKVAIGELPYLNIFGDDWPTSDGTGVRDYIHILDLIGGHLATLDWLLAQHRGCFEIFNLGCHQSKHHPELAMSLSIGGYAARCMALANTKPPGLQQRFLVWRCAV